jgi:CRP/FNR family transcriptional regulator
MSTALAKCPIGQSETRRDAEVSSLSRTPVTVRTASSLSNVVRLNVPCTGCAMRNVCVPAGFSLSEITRFEGTVVAKRRIAAGQHLFSAGGLSGSLFAIRCGFVKTSITTDDGREQVTGFHMMGEVVGIDALANGRHESDAVALEDTEVCEIPFLALENLSHDVPAMQRKRETMLLLGTMRAEERLAAFLLNLGRRYEARGFSALRFLLRMSRADIGSYLGLRLETVSRLFSRFQVEGLLRVDTKSVTILDAEGLKSVIGRVLN